MVELPAAATETNGKWTVLPLEKSLVRVDEVWDGIFDYNR